MAVSYDKKTPGVYVNEISTLPLSVASVSTAIPAFIGYTEKAVPGYGKPTKITTLKEYEDLFGKAPLSDEGAEAKIEANVVGGKVDIKMYGLKRLMHYSIQLFFNNGGASCYIVAVGGTGDETVDYGSAIDSLKLEDEPTIIIMPDATEEADYYTLCTKVLDLCGTMKDRFAIFDVPMVEGNTVEQDSTTFRTGIGSNDYLKYGAAYYPNVKTSLTYQYEDADVAVTGDETGILGAGDFGKETELYNKIKKAIAIQTVTLPASSAVAGIYARTDRDRGVWKAPANVSINSVIGPVTKLTESENDDLNVDATSGKSINAIRNFTGKGTLIWGARTLAGNDNEWRYISVRRLFNYIEESVQKATAFSVFEPNVAMTWLKIRSMIESFLDTLWRQGALAGGKSEDAYFVQCGLGTTMTSQDILEGRLIIKIGLAAVRPAEFIYLEFTHKLQES